MLRIRKQDSSVSLIEPPITLEKICISICIDKLVHSDDLRRDIARLKIISDDLLEKIIQHPQFIWRRGIIPAILSGKTKHADKLFYPEFISGQTDTVIYTNYCSQDNERISFIEYMLQSANPAELHNTRGYRIGGFIDDGRCIMYINPDHLATTRLYYSRQSEGFARMHSIPVHFDIASKLVISNNFLIVIQLNSFSVWQFVDAKPKLIGEATHNSYLVAYLLSKLVQERVLTLYAVQSILTLQWFRLYQQINPTSHDINPISASANFQFLLIYVRYHGRISGIRICNQLGSILHRIDFPEVNTINTTWLSEWKFCISSRCANPEMLVNFETDLVVSPLHLPIYRYDDQIRFIIPDQSSNYLLIANQCLDQDDSTYIYDMRSGKSVCLYGRVDYADVLFDSWFIIVARVDNLQRNIVDKANALFTKSSTLGQEVLQMNPKNHCVILVNLDLNQTHIVEYPMKSGPYATYVNAKKSNPYLLLNSLVFDARLGLDL